MPKAFRNWEGNPDHLSMLRRGVPEWNNWRERNPYVIPVLTKQYLEACDLRGADLSNAVLTRCSLMRADLEGANLYQAEFFGADLRDANLTEADMRGAKLHQADLRGASLNGADLYRADFIETRVDGASFSLARCETTTFADMDLSNAVDLESVTHTGPSSIDIATLIRSRQNVPVPFLRGTGLPRTFLDYGLSILADVPAIQFESVFISYSSVDEQFAQTLYDFLQQRQVRVWFAPEDMKPGARLHDQIDTAIRVHDRLLLVLSHTSLASSWVRTELKKAVRRERAENRRILFPVSIVPYEIVAAWECFDADLGIDLAEKVREYFIPDFSEWRDRSVVNKSYASVLSALKNPVRSATEHHGA